MCIFSNDWVLGTMRISGWVWFHIKKNTMARALFTDAELICFDHDIIKTIRKI